MNWVSDNTLIAQGSLDGEATSFEYTFPESCTDLGGVYKIVYQTELTEDISNVPDVDLSLRIKQKMIRHPLVIRPVTSISQADHQNHQKILSKNQEHQTLKTEQQNGQLLLHRQQGKQ